jgi:hypothetical protein
MAEQGGARPRKACVICWAEPTFKCSSCKAVRYCGRKCQVRAWRKHKSDCGQMLGELHEEHPTVPRVTPLSILRGGYECVLEEEPEEVD